MHMQQEWISSKHSRVESTARRTTLSIGDKVDVAMHLKHRFCSEHGVPLNSERTSRLAEVD